MIRSMLRNIARNRMKDMGIGNVNQKMGRRFGDKDTMPDRITICKLQKTPQGRDRLARIRKAHPALWTEVLTGSKKKDADEAFRQMSRLREWRRHPERVSQKTQTA